MLTSDIKDWNSREGLTLAGFSPEVVRLFEKHSLKLVNLGQELDKRDEIRAAKRALKN
jgi:hypothetical protein